MLRRTLFTHRSSGRAFGSVTAAAVTGCAAAFLWFTDKKMSSETEINKGAASTGFVGRFASTTSTVQCKAANEAPEHKLIFLGTGSSTGCPRPLCSLIFSKNGTPDPVIQETLEVQNMKQELVESCRTSNLAILRGVDPADNKNYRNNPSFLISLVTAEDHHTNSLVRKNVIIDVGKSFREGALRWLPRHSIRTLDAIVLTHEHMDAAGGLDDVRGFQKYFKSPMRDERPIQEPMPLFLSSHCLSCLQDEFPWLLPKPKLDAEAKFLPDGTPVVTRHVASFDVNIMESFRSFEPIHGLLITPLPVMHGEDLVSFGFAFTVGGMNVVYLSDISRMLPETLEYIVQNLPQPTHMLVLDALLVDRLNPVHYNLEQAITLSKEIAPQQTYLVGMNCDSFKPHDEMNEQLRQKYGNMQLAHDGLVIRIPCTRR
jgi:phosphoribosyl 1,2-cyclic phosphodiesterase